MNAQHKEFIKLIAADVDVAEAYKKVYKTKSNVTARTNGHKLVKRYKAEVKAEKKAYQDAIVSARDEGVVRDALSRILSLTEVDLKLSQIIKGEADVEKIVIVKGHPQVIKTCKPDHSDILKAIDCYYKRFGSYAAVKVDLPPLIKVGYE